MADNRWFIHVERKYEPSFVLRIYLNYVLNVFNYGYDIYVRRLVSLLSEPLSLSVTVVQMDLAESSTILTIALL